MFSNMSLFIKLIMKESEVFKTLDPNVDKYIEINYLKTYFRSIQYLWEYIHLLSIIKNKNCLKKKNILAFSSVIFL